MSLSTESVDALLASTSFLEDTTNYNATFFFENICIEGWLPLNHILFQVANICFFLSYFATTSNLGFIYLKITLLLGSLFFALWGWLILCALDTLIWNSFFVLVNLCQMLYIVYSLRPIRFKPDVEMVYKSIFEPMKVSRSDFQKIVNCIKDIRHLKAPDTFCLEKKSRINQLSLVLSGRFVVTQCAKILHVVSELQFLDSAEWFGVLTDQYYQVSITALTECKVLVWHKDKLMLTLSENPFLDSVLENILGRDVVKKLLLVNDSATINGTSLFVEDSETTSLLPQTYNHISAQYHGKRPKEIIDAETTV